MAADGFEPWNVGDWFHLRGQLPCRIVVLLSLGEEDRTANADEGEVMQKALKASFITSLGPALGAFVGLTVMVIALGGAYAFARESAAVGSIMYELLAARFAAEAAGVPLTREGMTVGALPVVFWIAAIGSFGWVLTGGVFTRWLPRLKDWLGGGDARRLQIITVAMMLGAFGRMLTNASIRPLITKGEWPAIVASLSAGLAAAIWLK